MVEVGEVMVGFHDAGIIAFLCKKGISLQVNRFRAAKHDIDFW